MSEDTTVSMVFCTTPHDHAERLARLLVEQHHAACVNIVPEVTSVYRWKGQVEQERESLLVIKCPRSHVDSLTEHLVAAHPYDVPEVVAWPIVSGHEPYLAWVRARGEDDGA